MDVPVTASMFSSTWFLALFLIVGTTTGVGIVASLFMRAVNRRDSQEANQSDRIQAVEEQVAQIRLEIAQEAREHLRRLHEVELKHSTCREQHQALTANLVSRADHHGDNLRIEGKIEKLGDDISQSLDTIHRRVDWLAQVLAPGAEA